MVNRPAPAAQHGSFEETRAKMGKLTLIAVLVLVVLVLGGVTLLAFWDPAPPGNRVEHAIPDARLPK